MRTPIILVFLVWLAIIPSMARGADRIGLKDLYIGQPLAAVDRAVYNCTVQEELGIARCLSNETLPFGNHGLAHVSADFLDGKCVAVLARGMQPELFEGLLAGLTVKFGKPTTHDIEDVSTAMGATYQNHEVTWERGAIMIMFSKYSSTVDQSAVSVVDKAAFGEFHRRDQGTPERAADNM